MRPILVLFASHFGQTRTIAERIAEDLKGLGHEVDLVDARYASAKALTPASYGAVVMGSRIELGRHAYAIRDYIRTHRVALLELPTAFFSVSMAASPPATAADPAGYMEAMFKDLDWKPMCAVAFGGGLPYRKYNWFLRFVMTRISRGNGHTTDTSKNHEFTDWKRVDAFADDIAAMLPASERHAV